MHTNQQILYSEIKRVSEKLNVKSLTCKEFLQHTALNRASIYRHGKSWTESVIAVGLKPTVVANVAYSGDGEHPFRFQREH
jgi:stress response protein SCP2